MEYTEDKCYDCIPLYKIRKTYYTYHLARSWRTFCVLWSSSPLFLSLFLIWFLFVGQPFFSQSPFDRLTSINPSPPSSSSFPLLWPQLAVLPFFAHHSLSQVFVVSYYHTHPFLSLCQCPQLLTIHVHHKRAEHLSFEFEYHPPYLQPRAFLMWDHSILLCYFVK